MWINAIIILFAILAGALIAYFVLRPRLHITAKRNIEIAGENDRLQQSFAELQGKYNTLREKKEELLASIYESQAQFEFLQTQASQSAQAVYDQSLALAQEKFAQAAEIERIKYLEAIDEYKAELENTMQEGAAAYIENISEQQEKCKALAKKYDALLATTNAAVAAAKRAEEIKQEASFYKINLSELDKEEITMLRNITPYLRDKEPLNKVIWKVYYEKPTTDLIGRVIGSGIHTGIYKITNLDNQMCYVGQAANLADRWKQHIKRGLGAETPTKNKLYPAMIAIGVENFSFEVIEECPRDNLDEREDYWQEYFKAKEFGYSIK